MSFKKGAAPRNVREYPPHVRALTEPVPGPEGAGDPEGVPDVVGPTASAPSGRRHGAWPAEPSHQAMPWNHTSVLSTNRTISSNAM